MRRFFSYASSVTSYVVHLKLMTPPTAANKTMTMADTMSKEMMMRTSSDMLTEQVWRTDKHDFVLEKLKPDSSYEVDSLDAMEVLSGFVIIVVVDN